MIWILLLSKNVIYMFYLIKKTIINKQLLYNTTKMLNQICFISHKLLKNE